MGTDESQRGAYDFLKKRAEDQVPFFFADIEAATKWTKKSWGTYKSKQYKRFIVNVPGGAKGALGVDKSFLRLSFDDFRALSTQVRSACSGWVEEDTGLDMNIGCRTSVNVISTATDLRFDGRPRR